MFGGLFGFGFGFVFLWFALFDLGLWVCGFVYCVLVIGCFARLVCMWC